MTAQIISSFEFWEAMIAKAVQKFNFGISTDAELIADLIRLGMDEDKATWFVLGDEEE